jgi:tRNA 2-thiouridine synthesizing protein E
VNGMKLAVDKHGYLLHLSDWNPEIAIVIAKCEGIELTTEHWELINFIRDYYQQYQTTPPIRLLVKSVAKKLGAEKGNSIYLQALFPGGVARQLSKIAGLPKPVHCI